MEKKNLKRSLFECEKLSYLIRHSNIFVSLSIYINLFFFFLKKKIIFNFFICSTCIYRFYLFVDCKYLEIVRKEFNSYVNYRVSSKFVKMIEKKVS